MKRFITCCVKPQSWKNRYSINHCLARQLLSRGEAAGFLLAGAHGVVSTLWAVKALSATLLLGRFYVNHLCGDLDEDPVTRIPLSLAAALRRAQQWLRDITAGELAANYRAEMQEP